MASTLNHVDFARPPLCHHLNVIQLKSEPLNQSSTVWNVSDMVGFSGQWLVIPYLNLLSIFQINGKYLIKELRMLWNLESDSDNWMDMLNIVKLHGLHHWLYMVDDTRDSIFSILSETKNKLFYCLDFDILNLTVCTMSHHLNYTLLNQ